jgi:hypothetical protein
MTKYFAVALVVALGAAAPANAQSTFQVGQKVKSFDSPPVACTTQDDLKNYKSVGMACAMGSASGCASAKDLETRKICGPHAKTFAVISIDETSGLMQIAPAKKPSETYWTDPAGFKAAK